MSISLDKFKGSAIPRSPCVLGRRSCMSAIPKSNSVKIIDGKNIEAKESDNSKYKDDSNINTKRCFSQSGKFFGKNFDQPPYFLKVSSSRNTTNAPINTQTVYDVLIPNVDNEDFEKIITKKLLFCKVIAPFTNSDQKMFVNRKTEVLQEISNTFFKDPNIHKISQNIQKAIFDTIYANIFEQDPMFPGVLESDFYSVQIIDPMWPHLSICFSILISFTSLFSNSDCFNESLVKRAIYLTNLPDEAERKQLYIFIKVLLEKRADFYSVILKSATDQLQDVVCGVVPPYCVGTLLQVLGILFKKSNMRPPEAFSETIMRSVLPLLSSRYFPRFKADFDNLILLLLNPTDHQASDMQHSLSNDKNILSEPSFNRVRNILGQNGKQLITRGLPALKRRSIASASSCVAIKKKMQAMISATDVITAISKYWPKTNCLRQTSILKTLFRVLDDTALTIPERKLLKISRFLAFLIGSPNENVSATVLCYIIEKPNWMKIKSKLVANIFLENILKTKEKEKSSCLIDLMRKSISSLTEMDKTSAISTPSECATIHFIANKNGMRWMDVLRLAESNYDDIDADDFEKSYIKMIEKGEEISKFV